MNAEKLSERIDEQIQRAEELKTAISHIKVNEKSEKNIQSLDKYDAELDGALSQLAIDKRIVDVYVRAGLDVKTYPISHTQSIIDKAEGFLSLKYGEPSR